MSTIYTIFSSAEDGQTSSSGATYADARAGSSLGVTTALDTIETGQRQASNLIYQGFYSFDTSTIPAGVAAADNILSLYITDISSGRAYIAAEPGDLGATLASSDFVPGADLGALPQGAPITPVGGDINTYLEFPITDAITRSANYWLMTFAKDQMDNVAPSSSTERFIAQSANFTGTSRDPFLTIEVADPPEADLAITLGHIAMASTGSAPAIATGANTISNVEIASTAIEITPAALAITLDEITANVGSESSFEGSTPARRRLALSASLQAGRTLSFARGA